MKKSMKIFTYGILAIFLMVSGASAREKIFLFKKHMSQEKIEKFIQKKEQKKNARFVKYLPLVNGVVMEIPDKQKKNKKAKEVVEADDAAEVGSVEANQKMSASVVALDAVDVSTVGLVSEPVTVASTISLKPWGTLNVYDHPYSPTSYVDVFNASYLDSMLTYVLPMLTNWSKVKVAVFDTGVDYTHPALSKYVVSAANFVDGDSGMDDNGHGTHVAGTITGQDTGVAPGSLIYSAKVLDAESCGTVDTLIDALNWAIANNVEVVSMSLAFRDDSPAVHQAIQAAHAAGITLIAAVGNHTNWEDDITAGDGGAGDGGAGDGGAGDGGAGDGGATGDDGTGDLLYPVMYPAKYPEVIAVSAYDAWEQIAPYANTGPETDVFAPGTAVFSTLPNNTYGLYNGTSMATPHVTGTVAILIALDKLDGTRNFSPDMIRDALLDTAQDGKVSLPDALGYLW